VSFEEHRGVVFVVYAFMASCSILFFKKYVNLKYENINYMKTELIIVCSKISNLIGLLNKGKKFENFYGINLICINTSVQI
jgi:hypothetical protein